MDYYVIGADGKEYGPTTTDQIRQWVQEGRVSRETVLKSFATGQTMPASAVAGLFPGAVATAPPPQAAPDWSQPPSPYARPQYAAKVDDGKGELVGAIIRSVLAVVFFFAFHGIGLVFAGYAVYYAIQANTKGHKYGPVGLAISILALLLVIGGWVLRMQSGAGY